MPIESEDTQQIPNGEDVVGSGNEARLKLMGQINDQNDTTLAENGDLADVNDDGSTTQFGLDQNLSDEEIAARELQRAADEANQVTEEEVPKHKIKVNGKELELTTDELVERAQKVESADEYLKEASRKLREFEVKKDPAPILPSPEDAAAKAKEENRALVRAIQMGTEDEALEAVEKLRARPPSVSTDDVARTVDERINFNDAVVRFQTEFKDLAEDPVLMNIVLQRDKELLEQGDKRKYWDRYKEIGTGVREWKESIAKPAVEAPKPSDKQTRKAAAPSVPQGAGTKAPAVSDEEDKEESTSDIISAIAKSRGGPQWLRS